MGRVALTEIEKLATMSEDIPVAPPSYGVRRILESLTIVMKDIDNLEITKIEKRHLKLKLRNIYDLVKHAKF